VKYSPDEHDGAVSETPETDALCNEQDADFIPNWECVRGQKEEIRKLARSLERRLSLAQTEIKGHMRIQDELKAQLVAWEKHGKLLGFTCGAFECDEAGKYHIFQNEGSELAQAQARVAELEKDAKRWKGLKDLAGHLQDGSQTTVLLDQDDATRTAFIKVGQKYYSVDSCGFDAAIDAALKDRA